MRRAYTVLAYVVAAEVVVQAMLVAWAVAGLGKWVAAGGVFDYAVIESQSAPFPEVIGIPLHGLNGGIVVPAIALALLVLSFFTRVRGAARWAGAVFGLAVLQGQLGYLGHEVTALAAVHGLNALLLFGVAVSAGRRMRQAPSTSAAQETPAAAAV